MTKRRIKVPATGSTVATAGAGQVITFDLDLGYRYHSIDIVFSDGANAQTLTTVLGDVIVAVNDTAERTHSAAELDAINGKNGTEYLVAQKTFGTSGTDREQVLTVYFDEPWRKTIQQADALAWNCDPSYGVNLFQVKITVAVALSATASITLYAMVDSVIPFNKNTPPIYKKVYRSQITASGVGNEINQSQLPSTRGAYQAIYLKQPSGTGIIQYVTLNNGGASGTVVWQRVDAYTNTAFLVGLGMNPALPAAAAGVFTYDLILDAYDPLQDAMLPASNGLWMKVEYTAAAVGTGNLYFLFETIGSLD